MFDFLKQKGQPEQQEEKTWIAPEFQEGYTIPLVAEDKDKTQLELPDFMGGWDMPTAGDSAIPQVQNGPEPWHYISPEFACAGYPADLAEQEQERKKEPDFGATLAGIPAYIPEREGSGPTFHGGDAFVRVDRFTDPVLECVQGVMQGRRINVHGILMLGVDYSCCDIVLPLGTPGISRRHLRLWEDGGRCHAMDLASTYGSLLNGERMKPGLMYTLNRGDVITLNQEQFRLL